MAQIEPRFRFPLGDDRKDLDFLVGDVIEDSHLFDAETVLRSSQQEPE